MKMNSEEKFNKVENAEVPENKAEKEFSMSEIDELLKESEKVSANLDKFSKDEIFKEVDFEDLRMATDKPDNRFDEVAYTEAGFGKKYNDFFRKFDYFTSFSLNKEKYELSKLKDREKSGILKSKDRGLLDKTKINENVVGKAFEIGQNNKQEKKYLEENILNVKDDESQRETFKTFYINNADGKIAKYVSSFRTEKGQMEAVNKMCATEIDRLDTDGAKLVGFKDALERNAKSKESFLKLSESMSNEDKEKVTSKLDEEEGQTKDKIKEKEEKLYEKTNKFREPLERRLQETLEIQDSLTEAFDFIKTGESNLNKQIKECESRIKEAQKLDLLGNVGADVLKIFENEKAELDMRAKELTEKKNIISSRLEVLKINKKETETALDRMNNIGKTKKEIEQGKKETEREGKDKETKPTENKKNGTESVDTEKDKDGEHNNEYSSEKTFTKEEMEIIKGCGYKLAKAAEVILKKDGKTSFTDEEIQIVRDGGYYLMKAIEAMHFEESTEEKKEDERIEIEEIGEASEKVFTHKEIEEIAMKELKSLGIMGIGDRTMREQVTVNVVMAVEAMITKSKKTLKEEEIKKEVGDWYRKYSKNYFKKGK